MDIFCTYCSAQKDHAEGNLPVLQRYQSRRIAAVAAAAQSMGIGFMVLSGRFGMIGPEALVPWYDHLLQPNEVESISALAARQLTQAGVKRLLFWMRPIHQDPQLAPYLSVAQNACRMAGVEFMVFVIQREELYD